MQHYIDDKARVTAYSETELRPSRTKWLWKVEIFPTMARIPLAVVVIVVNVWSAAGMQGRGFVAQADRRDESCGDEQRAFQAVVEVWRLGHEAKILAYSSFLCLSSVGFFEEVVAAFGLGVGRVLDLVPGRPRAVGRVHFLGNNSFEIQPLY